jgi:hypothetical protein
MFGVAKLTAVFLATNWANEDYFGSIKLTRTPAGSFTGDFLVYVSTGKNSHQWKIPFILDTGSWNLWAEAEAPQTMDCADT